MQGFKTYIGLAVALAGVLGLTEYITPENLENVIRMSFEIGGILFAAYGRYDRERRGY